MRGKSYLSLGGVPWASPARSWISRFFERYLGMRVEGVDMAEFVRRIEENIYDKDEFKRASPGSGRTAPRAEDRNAKPPFRAQKEREWEMVVKMAMIVRDLMVGNPQLAEARLRRGGPGP